MTKHKLWTPNYQIKISKLPTTNDQFHGRGVNYQMQIVIKLPNGTTKVAQNDSEQPILPNSLFQSFPTKVAQNDLQQAISPDSQLFFSHQSGSKWFGTAKFAWFATFQIFSHWSSTQNDSEQPILPDSQLFQSFPTEVAQHGQFHLIHNFANLFPPEWLRMTQNGQFCQIHNFSNLFSPNDQFCVGGEGINDQRKLWIPNYQMKISKPTNHKWLILGVAGGGDNDQTQIVNTKLPNEIIQAYQLQMIDSRGGG